MQTNNINCFVKILKRFGYKYKIINSYDDYSDNIIKLIIPGIGNYASCMEYIKNNKLDQVIYNHINQNKYILGICIGMQILSTIGEEGGIIDGLNIIPNTKTEKLVTNQILPHIGWNTLYITNKNDHIFKNINLNNDFYFVHSYNIVNMLDNCIDFTLATTKYGNTEFISIIKINNIYGIQFHPEKSGPNGIKLIENFLKLKT